MAVAFPGMELVLSLLALIIALVALGLVLGLQKRPAQTPGADPSVHLETLRQALVDLRRDMDHVQGELEELKAATEIVPSPPLPRARSGGLTDLREQLRAAHREPEPGAEE